MVLQDAHQLQAEGGLVPKPGPWGLVVLLAWFKRAPQSLTRPKASIWLRCPSEHP